MINESKKLEETKGVMVGAPEETQGYYLKNQIHLLLFNHIYQIACYLYLVILVEWVLVHHWLILTSLVQERILPPFFSLHLRDVLLRFLKKYLVLQK